MGMDATRRPQSQQAAAPVSSWSLARAPVSSHEGGMPRAHEALLLASSPTRKVRGGTTKGPPPVSNGYAAHAGGRRGQQLLRDPPEGSRVGSGLSSTFDRRSDGGTEDGSDTSSNVMRGGGGGNSSNKTSVGSDAGGVELPPASPTKRRKPKYTYDGKVQRSPTRKKPPMESEDVRLPGLPAQKNNTRHRYDADADSLLMDFPSDVAPKKNGVGSPKKRRPIPPPGSRSPKKTQRKPESENPELDDYFDSGSSGKSFKPARGASTSPVKRRAAAGTKLPRSRTETFDSDFLAGTPDSSRRQSAAAADGNTTLARNRPTRGRARSKPNLPSEGPSTPSDKSSRSGAPDSPTKKLKKGKSEAHLVGAGGRRRGRSVSPTKSAKDFAGSRIGTAAASKEENNLPASPSKSRYYFSKYGTWKELQRISQANMKKKPEEEDRLEEDVAAAMAKIEYLGEDEKSSYREEIVKRIRGDRYLASLCAHQSDYLHCSVHVLASFGTADSVVLGSRTQILVWYALERLRRFWILSGDPIPSEGADVLRHRDTMDFLSSVCKLCYNVSNTEQIIVTAVVEKDRRRNQIWLNFKQFGVRLMRSRLENLGIVRFHDRGPFLTESGHYLEVRFRDSLLIDFLGAVHVHVAEESIKDFSKEKLISSLPFFCGLASKEESSKGQRIVVQFLDGLSGLPRGRDPDFYLSALQNVWLESQQVWLNGIYEARLKKIYLYPPPGDRQIILALTTLRLHELMPLAYYLDNLDPKHVQLEGLLMQECGLDDAGLKMLGRNLWRVSRVQITGNYFTAKGIHDVTRTIRDGRDDLRIKSLDLSDSNINDECLERLVPVLPSLEELVLADNFLTWYGIRKVTQPQKKTRRLKRLDLSRCCLNEHAFYELIPLVLKTEQVTLEGNQFSPLELKIFARQVRDSEKLRLDTLVLNNCKLDDACLAEVAKFAYRVPNLHLQGGNFSAEGLRQVTKYCRRHDFERLRTLNLRGCKLDAAALEEAGEITPHLQSVTLSYNNFGGSGGDEEVRMFVSRLTELPAADRRVTFVDLRHCRLSDVSKRLLADIGRKEKIDIKMW